MGRTVALDNNQGYDLDDNVGYTLPSVGNMIVAGDGNAYVPYTYAVTHAEPVDCSEECYHYSRDTYFMVLRMSADASSSKTQFGHWTGECESQGGPITIDSGTALAGTPSLQVITNADTGAAIFDSLNLGDGCGGNPQHLNQLSYVSQNGLGSQVDLGANSFVPTLQREDGSYIGTDGNNNLVALGLDGSPVWQQVVGASPITPLYATADGGAIVTTATQCSQNVVGYTTCPPSFGTLYTVDQNGNVMSQRADTGATLSWTGNWYDPPPGAGTVSTLTLAALNWGYGAAAFGLGNPSKNLTATDRCPALDSTTNGLIEQGSLTLNTYLLYNSCPFCIAHIFPPLHTSQAEFTTYLLQGNSLPGQHRFCNGTKSMEPWATVDPENVTRISVNGVFRAPKNVGEYFQYNQGQIRALTAPKTTPLQVFFDPSLITNDLPYNESLVFHEALHGDTGVGDGSLLLAGGLCGILGVVNTYSDCYTNTNRITEWIENNVFTPQ